MAPVVGDWDIAMPSLAASWGDWSGEAEAASDTSEKEI